MPTSTTTISSPESIVGSHPRHNVRRQPSTPKRARPTPAPSPLALQLPLPSARYCCPPALAPHDFTALAPQDPRPTPTPSPPALQLLLPSARSTLSRQNFQPRTTLPLTTYPLDLLRPTHEPTPFASDKCPTFRSQLSLDQKRREHLVACNRCGDRSPDLRLGAVTGCGRPIDSGLPSAQNHLTINITKHLVP